VAFAAQEEGRLCEDGLTGQKRRPKKLPLLTSPGMMDVFETAGAEYGVRIGSSTNSSKWPPEFPRKDAFPANSCSVPKLATLPRAHSESVESEWHSRGSDRKAI
jgi:hypothetical protein